MISVFIFEYKLQNTLYVVVRCIETLKAKIRKKVQKTVHLWLHFFFKDK